MKKNITAKQLSAMGLGRGSKAFNKMFVKRPKETPEEKKQRLEEAAIRNKIRQGQKKFEYGKNHIWAINQKNADRKALNKGYKI